MTSTNRPVQKRNTYKILVTFPADWADEPALAGTTQEFSYPTMNAALEAQTGFRLRGATT